MKRKEFLIKASALASALFIPFARLEAHSTSNQTQLWRELLEYARWCPSPHNVQPWKVKVVSATEADLYYDPVRVPIVVDAHATFTIAGMGMFLECMSIVALSKGYELAVVQQPEPTLDCSGTDFRLFAGMSLHPTDKSTEVRPELIKERRTSRYKYNGHPIPSAVADRFKTIASTHGYEFVYTSDRELIHEIIDLNNATELQRSDDVATMNEMRRWIRTSDAEAAAKKDGLWYRCLDIPAKTLHNFIDHHWRFSSKWKRRLMKNMLNKGMNGTPHMAWISGPFSKRDEWLEAGAMLQRLWLQATGDNVFIHPFGTVITTPGAKEKFMQRVGYAGDKHRLWFLVRLGYSEQPQRSYRLDVDDILIS